MKKHIHGPVDVFKFIFSCQIAYQFGFQDYLSDSQQWIKAYEQLLMQRATPGPPPMKSSLESQLQPRCVRSVKHCLKRACRIFLLCQQCALHGEQYIMFSNSQKNMLCVNCFRDTPQEARLHCVDIDTAYTQGCKKLDRAVLVSNILFLIKINFYLCLF